MVSVKNIKISVKVKKLCLRETSERLVEQNITVKTYLNYITFHHKFSFVLFKQSKCGTNHVNVTKIKDYSHVHEAIATLKVVSGAEILSHRIDNIIATHSCPHSINLSDLITQNAFECMKYNPESFPGLFVKSDVGTVIIFHSGKLVIVGCKNLDQVWLLFQLVCTKIQS